MTSRTHCDPPLEPPAAAASRPLGPAPAVGAWTDSTRRKELESGADPQGRCLNAFFTGATAGLVLIDKELRYVRINDTLAEMNGVTPEAHLGRTIREVLPALAPAVEPLIRRVLETGVPILNVPVSGSTFGSHDGPRYWEESFFPICGEDGSPEMVGAIVVEVTTRIRTEMALRESEERLRAALADAKQQAKLQDQLASIAASVPGLIYSFELRPDGTARMPYASAALDQVFGLSQAAVSEDATCIFDLVHPNDIGTFRESILASARTLEPWSCEFRMRIAGRGEGWFEGHSVPRREPDGTTVWHGFVRDTTARKHGERALAQESARRELLFEQSRDGIVVLDQTGAVVQANQRYAEMLGYSSAEVRGLHVWDWDTRWDREDLLRMIGQVGPKGDHFETQHRRKDGSIVDVEISSSGTEWEDQKLVLCVCRDITERKRTEGRLQQLSRAVEQSPSSIVITDPAGEIEYVNASFTRVSGYSAAEVLGRNPRVLKAGDMPPEIYADLWTTIAAGREWRGELHNRRQNGELFWEFASISPVLDETGAITHFIGVKEDITERKRAEAERATLQMQLQQAQKLESIGRLAAGIAHEINTPTQYIGDNARFLQDACRDLTGLVADYDRLTRLAAEQGLSPELTARVAEQAERADLGYLLEEIPKAIEQSLQGVERVSKIVRAMKEFSHPGTGERAPTDLNRAIETTITVARNEWKYVADMVTDFDASAPEVPCLVGEFNQTILNLVVNAAHAIEEAVGDGGAGKGTITISTRRDGDWFEVRVADTGAGIPEALRPHMFEPFFTTKPVGKGTGQGLAIARSVIVDKHGGTIDFESEVGRGTTFIIRLPMRQPEERRTEGPDAHCQ